MTLAVPSHLVDTMGSAAATGVEAAGHLLHEVGNAVSSAAVATTDRARSWSGLGRRNHWRVSGRTWLVLGAFALGAVIVLGRRSRSHDSTLPADGMAARTEEPSDSPASAAAS